MNGYAFTLCFAFIYFIRFVSSFALQLLLIHSQFAFSFWRYLVFFSLFSSRPIPRLLVASSSAFRWQNFNKWRMIPIGCAAKQNILARKRLEMGRKWSGLFFFFRHCSCQMRHREICKYTYVFHSVRPNDKHFVFVNFFAFAFPSKGDTLLLNKVGRRNGLNWFAYFSGRWSTHSISFNLMHKCKRWMTGYTCVVGSAFTCIKFSDSHNNNKIEI